jgi:hypothetical protein
MGWDGPQMGQHALFGHMGLLPEEEQVELGFKVTGIMAEMERTMIPVIRELLRLEASRVLEHAKRSSPALRTSGGRLDTAGGFASMNRHGSYVPQ